MVSPACSCWLHCPASSWTDGATNVLANFSAKTMYTRCCRSNESNHDKCVSLYRPFMLIVEIMSMYVFLFIIIIFYYVLLNRIYEILIFVIDLQNWSLHSFD